MKKLMFIMISMFLFVPLTVEARECKYGLQSPVIYHNGSWSFGTIYKYKTSASSCLANNITVTFDSGSYFLSEPVDVEGYLMEDDQEPNADDPAKQYIGKSRGGIISWNLTTTHPGNLDSSGDQTCELYMKFRLLNGTPGLVSYYQSDLFRYTVCVE